MELPTPKEREALTLRTQGASYKQIAQAMNISEGTARQYLHRGYEKVLGADIAATLKLCEETVAEDELLRATRDSQK